MKENQKSFAQERFNVQLIWNYLRDTTLDDKKDDKFIFLEPELERQVHIDPVKEFILIPRLHKNRYHLVIFKRKGLSLTSHVVETSGLTNSEITEISNKAFTDIQNYCIPTFSTHYTAQKLIARSIDFSSHKALSFQEADSKKLTAASILEISQKFFSDAQNCLNRSIIFHNNKNEKFTKQDLDYQRLHLYFLTTNQHLESDCSSGRIT